MHATGLISSDTFSFDPYLMSLLLRAARPSDVALVLALVRELAAYERLDHEVDASDEGLRAALFGEQPRVFAEIAEWEGEPAGFALWFYNFSTFRGRHGIYLEDLYVRQTFRGQGVGVALLKHLAKTALARGCGRLEWSVLDWNQRAIDFYKSLGAAPMNEWTTYRVTGAALTALGGE